MPQMHWRNSTSISTLNPSRQARQNSFADSQVLFRRISTVPPFGRRTEILWWRTTSVSSRTTVTPMAWEENGKASSPSWTSTLRRSLPTWWTRHLPFSLFFPGIVLLKRCAFFACYDVAGFPEARFHEHRYRWLLWFRNSCRNQYSQLRQCSGADRLQERVVGKHHQREEVKHRKGEVHCGRGSSTLPPWERGLFRSGGSSRASGTRQRSPLLWDAKRGRFVELQLWPFSHPSWNAGVREVLV